MFTHPLAPRCRHYSVGTALLFALVASASTASAAPSTDPASAEALFEQGRTAAGKGDWPRACTAFEQSEKLDPAAGTLLNLADCRVHLGKLASAWQDFVEAQRELPGNDDRRSFTQEKITELEKRLPRLVVTLRADAPTGSVVVKDGVEMPSAMLGNPLPVDPGTVTLVVQAPGHQPATFTVTTHEGKTDRVEVAAGEATPVKVEAPPAPPGGDSGHASHEGSPMRTAGFVVGGIGVAGLVAGAVTGGLALSNASKYKSACGASFTCTSGSELSTANSAANNAKTFSAVATVALAAGGAAAVGGLILVLTHPADQTAPSTTMGFAPMLGGASAVLRGTF